MEIEIDGPLFQNFTETLEVVRNNYGYAGIEFVRYLQELNISELKNRYYDICHEIEQCDSTGKQIQNLAILVLADQLIGECIFKYEEELNLDQLSPILKKKQDVSVSERAFQRVIDWIASESSHFSEDCLYGVYGKIVKNYAIINKSILSEFLEKNEFDFNSVKSEWAKKGYLIKDTNGQYTVPYKLNGMLLRVVKLRIEDDCGESIHEGSEFQQLTMDNSKEFPFSN